MADATMRGEERESIREVLTPPVRRMLLGVASASLGNGMILSLLVVYLHQVRGLPLQLAGLVLAFQALLGLLVSPGIGTLIDRFGPKPVLLLACVVEAAGTVSLGFVQNAPQAFAATSLVAIGGAALWPAQAALLARLTTPVRRQRVFGLQFMLLNLGIGLGGLIGAAVVDVTKPVTFTLLYAANAVTFLGYLAAVAGLHGVSGPERADSVDEEGDQRGGYGQVARDRRLRRFVVGGLILLVCGYGSMEAGIPAFITTVVGLPVNMIGVVFAFNTAVIVVAQVWVLRRMEGRSRARFMFLTAVAWAACWLLLAASAGVGRTLAAVLLILGVSIFAIGETLWSPTLPALINDLAAPHLRGRYNAVAGLVWGVAGTLGPAIAGAMLGAGLGVLWAFVVAAGALLGGLVLLSLRRLLTPEEDGRRPSRDGREGAPAGQVPG